MLLLAQINLKIILTLLKQKTLANCVSGLNNISNMNNSGWYFSGNKIDSQGCQGNDVAVLNSDRVGVYQLQQCGTFTTAVEGIYSCQTFGSDISQQVIRLGVYLHGRSKLISCIASWL